MNAFLYLLYLVLTVYIWLIVGRALLSWVRPTPGSVLFRIDKLLYRATEPYVGLFRRVLPQARIGAVGLDLSPLVALLVLIVAVQVVARLVARPGMSSATVRASLRCRGRRLRRRRGR